MMKFFRKYTKHMLAVFMALLLIVWLAGDAIDLMIRPDYDPGDTVAGTANGRQIKIKDMRPAFAESELLEMVSPALARAPWFYILLDMGASNDQAQQFAAQIRSAPLNNEEWYMLDLAARQAQIRVPDEEVARFKQKFGITAEVLNAIKQRTRQSFESIDEAIKSFIRVREAAVLAAAAAKVTEADMNRVIRYTNEQARIVAVSFDAGKFLDESYQPTDEEIRKQYDQYKNVASRPAGSGDYGYELPETAQIEYLQVDAAALVSRQKVEEDEAFQYWQSHKNEFMKPVTTTAPSTQPQTPRPYTSFSEARSKVFEKLAQQRAEREAARIARDIITQLQRPWLNAPTTQPTGVKVLPTGQDSEQVYQAIRDDFEKKYPGAISYGRTQAMTPDAFNRDPNLGAVAALRDSEQATQLSEAAFTVPPLVESPEAARQARFYRALYQTASEPFIAPDGDAYVIRTVAVTPRRSPELDQVRDRVIADIREQRAFEAAVAAAKAFEEAARKDGIEAAFNASDELKTRLGADALKKPQPVSLQMPFIAELGYVPDLLSQLVEQSGETTTQPTRITRVEQKYSNRVLVAELVETLPVTREEYDRAYKMYHAYLQGQKRVQVLNAWFSPDQIRQRIGWVDAPKEKSNDESADEAEASL